MSDTASKFFNRLAQGQPVISDGAMGTMLHAHGAGSTVNFDALNLENPELVGTIHSEYIAAGATMIQTNTFGANRFKLNQHSLLDQMDAINRAGVEIARQAVHDSGRDILIAGDVGPLGVRIAPFGRVQLDEARTTFADQIRSLASAGVDLIVIETIADLYEIVEAVKATRETAPNLPVLASMTFTRDNLTLLGDPAGKVARRLNEAGADVIGINCSGGPHQVLDLLKKMRSEVPDARFSVMPNAGWPHQVEGRIMYPAGAEYFGEYALSFWKAGASVMGGCCGTTPEHIQAMAQSVAANPETVITPVEQPVIRVTAESRKSSDLPPTTLDQKLEDGKFVVAVEMDPPRGLSTHKMLAGASLLAEAGADVIDVADSPMARMRMSPWAVCSLIQNRVGIETVLHFPTRGRNLLRVQGDLLAAHALDVRNIFVVMGDPTSIGDYPSANNYFDLVPSGLLKLIKQGFNAGVDHAGSDIGQPTSFFAGCALNLNPENLAEEIRLLRRKIKAGADFILTQPIYDARLVTRFLDTYQNEFGNLEIPLLVGFLPLASVRHANFLQQEVPGIVIPSETIQRIQSSGEKAAQTGIAATIDLVEQVRPQIQGIYLMPAFHRYDYAAEIIEAIK
ncbi:MAG: bifunctional homocysteine S-methyltransferase/methylenetetrahydrofolate reductase [Anaerolineaceae bacterium]